MPPDAISTRVKELAEPILSSLGLELVELEYKRGGRESVLRLYIDKVGGVTLDDCAVVSRELSRVLDVEDFIRGHYNLEVSSPGLNRPLKTENDFQRYRGRLVKIRTSEPFPDDAGNPRKTFLGVLQGLEDGVVRVTLTEGQGAGIPLEKITRANLEFEF